MGGEQGGADKAIATATCLLHTLSSVAHPFSLSCPVAALETLALSDQDPRVRRACALPLAMLCHAVKRTGGVGGADAADGASKGLSQLPADGALRPLLESLLEGRWALPHGEWCAG